MNYYIEENENYRMFIMKDYKYSAIIIDKTSEPPTYLLPELRGEFINKNITGNILIDSLLYAGNSEYRFIKADFRDCGFVEESFEFVEIERGNLVRQFTSDYLRCNSELIEFSILSSMQKRLVVKGCNL